MKKKEKDKVIFKSDLIPVFDTGYCNKFSWPDIVAHWVEYGTRFQETEGLTVGWALSHSNLGKLFTPVL